MKKSFLFYAFFFAMIAVNFGQKPAISLTFTAVNDTNWYQLDSIRVVNCSQDCDTMLYYNDTVLVIDLPLGMHEMEAIKERFALISYPNPVTDRATVELELQSAGQVFLRICDVQGRIHYSLNKYFSAGGHIFEFVPGNSKLYFISASCNGYSRSVKLLSSGYNNYGKCTFSYIESNPGVVVEKSSCNSQRFEFSAGDELLLIGYADTLESGLLDSPEEDTGYIFQFAFDIPCPGIPSLIHEGRIYHTVQIFSQCWLIENLNVGTMINGSVEMTDNGILEKYCYSNDTNKCDQYGGLYQWDEMMSYSMQQGTQGICPAGWHIPADNEWKILEGAVDSQYGIGDQVWNLYGLRGYDAGTHLKSINGWYGSGNGSDSYGFSGLPGGYRYSDGNFYYKSLHALWWSSTDGNATSAWNRYLSYNNPVVDRDYGNNKGFGFNVRCIKD